MIRITDNKAILSFATGTTGAISVGSIKGEIYLTTLEKDDINDVGIKLDDKRVTIKQARSEAEVIMEFSNPNSIDVIIENLKRVKKYLNKSPINYALAC